MPSTGLATGSSITYITDGVDGREMTAWIAISMMGLMDVVAKCSFLVSGWCLGIGPFHGGGGRSERV